MRSARRRNLIEKKKNAVKTAKLTGLLFKILIPAILITVIFAVFKLGTKYWNGQDKFMFSYRLDNGDVAVTVLDPKLEEVTTLAIPGDTQVDVARNLGELRIKNVWQLGVNEKIEGKLLAETITQNFLFPVFLWSDADAKCLTEANILCLLRFTFFPKSTNISFGDRLASSFFALRITGTNVSWLDLGKNQFLVKQKLNDGVIGYSLTGPVSPRLTMYFSDSSFADKNLRVVIVDSTGIPGVAEKVGQIIEVMGGKVVSVDKVTPGDKETPGDKKESAGSDCLVMGLDKAVVAKIATLFSCKTGKNRGEMDLEIDLGSNFAKRF
jgi:hypothetical protein